MDLEDGVVVREGRQRPLADQYLFLLIKLLLEYYALEISLMKNNHLPLLSPGPKISKTINFYSLKKKPHKQLKVLYYLFLSQTVD